MVCSAFRDFGFEPLPAVLWGLAGWAIGFMVRLSRLYPFQPFEETDLNALAGKTRSTYPVILKGQIVPADELKPKGEVVFKQDEKTLKLNPIKATDIILRLFGLSNPRQLLQGDVTVKGWYRPGIVPMLEVQEVRSEKTFRKSMVKSLRWAAAISLLVLAVIVSLALNKGNVRGRLALLFFLMIGGFSVTQAAEVIDVSRQWQEHASSAPGRHAKPLPFLPLLRNLPPLNLHWIAAVSR